MRIRQRATNEQQTCIHYTQILAFDPRNLPWLMSSESPLRHGTVHPSESIESPWCCDGPELSQLKIQRRNVWVQRGILIKTVSNAMRCHRFVCNARAFSVFMHAWDSKATATTLMSTLQAAGKQVYAFCSKIYRRNGNRINILAIDQFNGHFIVFAIITPMAQFLFAYWQYLLDEKHILLNLSSKSFCEKCKYKCLLKSNRLGVCKDTAAHVKWASLRSKRDSTECENEIC